jgi:hypothetical protein
MSGQGSSTKPANKGNKEPEVTSPVKPRKPWARKDNGAGKNQAVTGEGGKTVGQKRKQIYVPRPKVQLTLTNFSENVDVDEVSKAGASVNTGAAVSTEDRSDDSNKKRKNSATLRSADQAAAESQPRQTQ